MWSAAARGSPLLCCARQGRDVLDHFNIPASSADLWRCVGVLAVLALGYRVMAFALLLLLSRRSRA